MKRIIAAAAAVGIVAGGCQEEEGTTTVEANMEALMNPDGAEMNKTAPASFKAKFETSAGEFVIEVTRDWAPHGADRFYNLVRNGFYNETRFFRVIPGFIVQWGMHGDPEVTAKWHGARIPDDPVRQGNELGTVTFAKPGRGKDNRTVQVFINLADNTNLDGQKFAAFGKVVSGMEAVEAINAEYEKRTPNQGQIAQKGNKYLEKLYPNLDYIRTATIVD